MVVVKLFTVDTYSGDSNWGDRRKTLTYEPLIFPPLCVFSFRFTATHVHPRRCGPRAWGPVPDFSRCMIQ